MSDSPFRGLQGIPEIKARILSLISFYEKQKPDIQELCLNRNDYDLIARWPRAANCEGFVISHDGIFYKGFRLTFDTGEGRYQKSEKPKQTVIS